MKVSNLLAIIQCRKQRDNLYCKAEYWDAKAIEYSGHAVSMWPNNNLNYHYHHEQMRVLKAILPDLKGKRVLDVGCGTGRVSRYLVQLGAEVVGVDFSEQAIAIARQQNSSENITYRVQSIFDLTDTNAYDIVICWGVIAVACKMRFELLDLLIRLSGALKPGGQTLFLEPIHTGFFHRVLNMDISEFLEVMSEAQLQVKSVQQLHFCPMRLALASLPLPKLITTIGYHLGEFLMKLPGLNSMGDYKVILANKSSPK
jgi:2-polyprenyl-3-methyl-5-hydroxy-6-metoxy-1,4-benzoquinol methylase